MDPIPMPPPYGGINEQIPVIALESPQCENLLNFNVTQEGVTLRNGDSKYTLFTAANASVAELLTTYGNTKAFVQAYNSVTNKIDIYDVDAGTLSFSSAALGNSVFYDSYFNNYLFFFEAGAHAPGYYYDGAAFGSIGYTGAGLAPAGGCSFKERHFIIQAGSSAYWYSDIEAITGALTKVDLASVISEKSNLAVITPITLADNIASTMILAFVFFSGEILFYAGSYPDASDWSIIGRARVGSIINYNNSIAYQGDSIILSDSGVFSLRDLFLKGSTSAASLILNTRIQDTWVNTIKGYRNSLGILTGPIAYVRGIWDSQNSRIIISIPGYLDSNGSFVLGSFFFVFNALEQAWYFHRSFGVTTPNFIIDMVKYKNKVLLLSNTSPTNTKFMAYQKEGATGFTDRSSNDTSDVGMDYEIKSAPVSNGRAYVQRGEGLDVILKSDLYSETNYYLIRDFGVLTTSAQKVPDQGSGLQKPFVNVGIEGSYIQYKIAGTTVSGKTVGYQLYGVNFWVSLGNSPR